MEKAVKLYRDKKYRQAIKEFERYLKKNPRSGKAHEYIGKCLLKLGIYEQVVAGAYEKEHQSRPSDTKVLSHLVYTLYKLCDWKKAGYYKGELFKLTNKELKNKLPTGINPFISLGLWDDPKLNLMVAKSWAQQLEYRVQGKGFRVRNIQVNKRIVIGYLSDGFRNHPTGRNLLDVIQQHDRTRFQIKIFSLKKSIDKIQRQYRQIVDKFVDLPNKNDGELAKLIRKEKVDILVDLKGFLTNNRFSMFALNPAPIIINYLGYPGTTGADFVDYIIADKYVMPKTARKYVSEEVLYMPCCYRPIDQGLGHKVKDIVKKRQMNKIIFGSFNHTYKITPEIFEAWIKILKKVPNSVLWQLASNKVAITNLKLEAKARGVNPKRIIGIDKLKRTQHLSRMTMVDIVLDTSPVNGHSTTVECLTMGVPVITIKGNQLISRVSKSCLKNFKLDELVANDLREYEQIAIDLGKDNSKLQEIKNKLQENVKIMPWASIEKYTKDLEKLYEKAFNSRAN